MDDFNNDGSMEQLDSEEERLVSALNASMSALMKCREGSQKGIYLFALPLLATGFLGSIGFREGSAQYVNFVPLVIATFLATLQLLIYQSVVPTWVQGWAGWTYERLASLGYRPVNLYGVPASDLVSIKPALPAPWNLALAVIGRLGKVHDPRSMQEYGRSDLLAVDFFRFALLNKLPPLPRSELVSRFMDSAGVLCLAVGITVLALFQYPDMRVSGSGASMGQALLGQFYFLCVFYSATRMMARNQALFAAFAAHFSQLLGRPADLPELEPLSKEDRPKPWA